MTFLSDCNGDDGYEVEEEEEEEEESEKEGVREEGGRDEDEELTVPLLVALRLPVGFPLTLTVAPDYLPGAGLVSLSTGDIAGAPHPGTKYTI